MRGGWVTNGCRDPWKPCGQGSLNRPVHSSGGCSSRSRCQQSWFLTKALEKDLSGHQHLVVTDNLWHSLICRSISSLCLHCHLTFSLCVPVPQFPICKTPGPTLLLCDLILTMYICKYLISKSVHILRPWGVKTKTYELELGHGDTQFIPLQKIS